MYNLVHKNGGTVWEEANYGQFVLSGHVTFVYMYAQPRSGVFFLNKGFISDHAIYGVGNKHTKFPQKQSNKQTKPKNKNK